FDEGEDVAVGDVIAKVDESGEASATPAESKEEAPKTEEKAEEAPAKKETEQAQEDKTSETPDVIASPAARKRARELGIDLSAVQTRDPLGRIRPEDVEAAKAAESKPAAKAAAPAPEKDRKSTRLNSSHVSISYAVFCLKKKK